MYTKKNVSFRKDNHVISNDKDIASGFNDYFVNIGKKLAENIPECKNAYCMDYLDGQNTNTMFLS